MHLLILKKLMKLVRNYVPKKKKALSPADAIHLHGVKQVNFPCFERRVLFDKAKGFYSVREAAERLGITTQRVYSAIYRKKLHHLRKDGAYVLHIDDIKEHEKTLNRQPIKKTP